MYFCFANRKDARDNLINALQRKTIDKPSKTIRNPEDLRNYG